MYAVTQTKLTATQPAAILALAAQFTDFFAFENPQQPTQLFGFEAFSEQAPTNLATAVSEIDTWAQSLRLNIPQAAQEHLKLMGSFAFEDQPTAQTNIWGDFANGRFFLPKYTLEKTAADTYDLFVVANSLAQAQKQAAQFKQALAQQVPLDLTPNDSVQQTELAVNDWAQAVGQTVEKLQQAQLQKVVLARPLTVESNQTFSAEKAWLNLRHKNPETYHVLYRHRQLGFVSATPEHLIRFDHQKFHTVAIAGTCPTGKTAAETEQLGTALLNDAKNRQEQQFVTQTIIQNLQALHAEIHYSETPDLLVNKNVQHLATPIWGHLTSKTTPFQLIATLHPTPALGGLPRNLARQTIANTEILRRGLFGGPIGYLNFAQQGEFVVGIRSALLNQKTATLFAGAGIVKDSDPKQEVVETRLKFQPMLQSLLEGN
ncbi:isochorismate synthase MenF [Agrilactobacillus yilanensis]|uniref:isochorismate synthase n=1 Tax=Agrilactobacillus yilanensis TaxID=2485997 RepID=A0ABW4J914_9LACO|nr:isochorismate synthase [Agrilactobacillus yilanensis]